jgi:FkbM family methyltransferase
MKRLTKGLSALTKPWCWSALIRGVVPAIEHEKVFAGYKFDTVIDVGANKGQFATLARYMWPNALLICFEPLTAPRARMNKITKLRAIVHSCAVGEIEGQATMHIASRTDSSSLLNLGEAQKKLYKMEKASELIVPVRRLDSVIDGAKLTRTSLLKIDVQGFEYEVLQGAQRLLPFIDVVYVEASNIELYSGQKLAPEVIASLEGKGFKLISSHNNATVNNKILQSDLLFKKEG